MAHHHHHFSITPSSVTSFVAVWTCAVLLHTVTSELPLDEYIAKPDDHYNYTLLTQTHEDDYTVHILNMTSQKWMDEAYTDTPIWWHYLIIVVPKQIKTEFKDTAFLAVGEGTNNDPVPGKEDYWLDILSRFAVASQTVTAVIKQVPNQPIVFKSDPCRKPMGEDALLAWSWKQFMLNTDQPESLAFLPMTKTVVRAMDTIDSYSIETRQKQSINKFFLTGGSKRGWTTWLTAAVDSRIIGMAPTVGDFLNMNEFLLYHHRSLGGWSVALNDYTVAISELGTKEFNLSLAIIDPMVYKDRYDNIPTYILKATGDQFVLPDLTVYYYNQLRQPRYLRIIPNTDHGFTNKTYDAYRSVYDFYYNVLHGVTNPKVNWTMTSSSNATSGTIHVTTDREPSTVTVYQADTLIDGRRDFRLWEKAPGSKSEPRFHPVFWYKGQANKLSSTEYEGTVQKPPFGWTGFFIEMEFEGQGQGMSKSKASSSRLIVTTEILVLPDTHPFQDCRPHCGEKLV